MAVTVSIGVFVAVGLFVDVVIGGTGELVTVDVTNDCVGVGTIPILSGEPVGGVFKPDTCVGLGITTTLSNSSRGKATTTRMIITIRAAVPIIHRLSVECFEAGGRSGTRGSGSNVLGSGTAGGKFLIELARKATRCLARLR